MWPELLALLGGLAFLIMIWWFIRCRRNDNLIVVNRQVEHLGQRPEPGGQLEMVNMEIQARDPNPLYRMRTVLFEEFQKRSSYNGDKSCPICLVDFHNLDQVCDPLCGHISHASCARTQFNFGDNNCPLCRATLTFLADVPDRTQTDEVPVETEQTVEIIVA